MSNALPAPGLACTFTAILDALCASVAERMARHRALVPLLMLLHIRLARLARRFAALVARAAAGPIEPAQARKTSAAPKPAKTGEKPRRLPAGFGWLLPLMPHVAAGYASQLQHLLSGPEMTALLDAAPGQTGRLLRPLYRMLAMDPSRLPPPARRAAPPPRSPSHAGNNGSEPDRPAADFDVAREPPIPGSV